MIAWTGFKNESITAGLDLLTNLGWVVAINKRGPWALADQGRQLPLVNFFDEDESEKIGLEPIIITKWMQQSQYIESGNNNKNPSPKKSDSHKNPNFEANMKACRAGGIIGPKAIEISDGFGDLGEPFTPDFIKAHCDDAGRSNIGLAIVRILSDQLPPSWEEELDSIPRPGEKHEVDDD